MQNDSALVFVRMLLFARGGSFLLSSEDRAALINFLIRTAILAAARLENETFYDRFLAAWWIPRSYIYIPSRRFAGALDGKGRKRMNNEDYGYRLAIMKMAALTGFRRRRVTGPCEV